MAIPLVYNLRSVGRRWVSSSVAVVGIGGAVGVFISTMSLARGFQAALLCSGSPGNALVLRGGATSEMESTLSSDQVRTIADAAGVARRADGSHLASPEIVVVATLPRTDTGKDGPVQARGVTEVAFDVHERIRVTQGRVFHPGLAELLVGKGASTSFRGLAFGSRPRFGGRQWDVVGVFDASGSAFDSVIFCDASLLREAFDRPVGAVQSVTVRLEKPDAYLRFKDAITSNPALTASVELEVEYYARQSHMLTAFIRALGFMVAFTMGIGAVFAALNTMYSAVSARAREVATLRALGFRPGSIVMSFVLESLLVALVGGLAGSLAAIPTNGLTVSTMNWQTWSNVAFAFKVTPVILGAGIAFALVMGLIGGLLPAVRAARLPIATGLREL